MSCEAFDRLEVGAPPPPDVLALGEHLEACLPEAEREKRKALLEDAFMAVRVVMLGQSSGSFAAGINDLRRFTEMLALLGLTEALSDARKARQ